jgi:hypothetical protein
MVEPWEIEHQDSNLTGLKIADPHYVFRGMTYGQWAGVRWNQVLSAQPDDFYDEGRGIVFLRGAAGTGHLVEDEPDRQSAKTSNIYSAQTSQSRLKLPEGTAVFVPVVDTVFVIGDEYRGSIMKDEIATRFTARTDTVHGGDIWAKIKVKPNDKSRPLVKDLNYFYTESPLFSLRVSEKNPFKDKIDVPIKAGNYFGVTVGIYVIISYLPPNKRYHLEFGGQGVGGYFSNSMYDIEVIPNKTQLNDTSKESAS